MDQKTLKIIDKNYFEAMNQCSKCVDLNNEEACWDICTFKLTHNLYMIKNKKNPYKKLLKD